MNSSHNTKCTLYVGGLDTLVTSDVLYATFIPFGEVKSVELPPDPTSGNLHRGFGFVEFELEEDANEAVGESFIFYDE